MSNPQSEADEHVVVQLEHHGVQENENFLPPLVNKFSSREELLDYVRNFSSLQGYATTIRDSFKDKYVRIGCDRGGTYRNRMKNPVEDRKRKTGSRLINCPFRIKGIKLVNGSWTLKIEDANHNHEASMDISGHPYLRRFSKEEFSKIKEMSKSGIPPRQILMSLRQANPNCKAISRTIYNAKAKIREEELGGRSPIQALLEELSKGGFTHDFRLDGEGRLTHLFFAHPQSITLTKSYPTIFVMDCTYKTNKFKMPLLDIIGVSSFNTSFYSCFAFLSKEEEGDYFWALSMFKKMLGASEPSVIVSDRELALMNAITVVFPRTTNLICVWHIEKNILAKCKQHFSTEKDWTEFLGGWTEVVNSDSESSFNEAWREFEIFYQEKAVLIEYIKKTWLPYKEHFVKAWTDSHIHFGNRVTSRAEGAHAVLKRYLQVSTNDLHVASEKMCLAVENSYHEIKAKLASERIRVPHNICVPFFKELVHKVSLFALEKLYKQYQQASSSAPLPACKGYFAATMGLPCAHMMRNMMGGALPLSAIHSQWRIEEHLFGYGNNETNDENDKLSMLFQELTSRYHHWPISQKEATQNQLSQLINASTPLVFNPVVQPHKGRPSGSSAKRISNSTRRDPSALEIGDSSRKCSKCRRGGHNSRTCQREVTSDTVESDIVMPNAAQTRKAVYSFDLNSMPSDSNFVLWD